jgi:hypothetical protein
MVILLTGMHSASVRSPALAVTFVFELVHLPVSGGGLGNSCDGVSGFIAGREMLAYSCGESIGVKCSLILPQLFADPNCH